MAFASRDESNSIGRMKFVVRSLALAVIIMVRPGSFAQPTPDPKTDVSNKALITKSTPAMNPAAARAGSDIVALRKIADEFYAWRNQNFPVGSSEAGLRRARCAGQ